MQAVNPEAKVEPPCLLIGDIGGTNARFALAGAGSGGYSHQRTYQCADFPTAGLALKAYLARVGAPRPKVICLAAAGPIVEGRVRFTNNHWRLDAGKLEREFEGAAVRLLNDFEAGAYALPWLRKKDCRRIGLPLAVDLQSGDFTVGVIGPGTGLGAAGLCRRGDALYPIVGEAGHVGFAPETRLQMEVLAHLHNEFDRVSDERLVSGPGIVNLYRALGRIRNSKIQRASAAKVFSLGAAGDDSIAVEAVQLFFEILGQLAGNLALSLGAYDGIFIGGGIVTRNQGLLAARRFRAGFERKGRHRLLMKKIPTQLILHPQPGLLGASYCALQMSAAQAAGRRTGARFPVPAGSGGKHRAARRP